MFNEKNSFAYKWPSGAIRSHAELQDILDSDNENIKFYAVTQSGYIEEFMVPPESRIERNNISFYLTDTEGKTVYISDRGVSVEGNIPSHSNHRLFINKMHATNYSNWMKTDKVYIQDVKNWHKHCDEMFRGLDDYYDDY